MADCRRLLPDKSARASLAHAGRLPWHGHAAASAMLLAPLQHKEQP